MQVYSRLLSWKETGGKESGTVSAMTVISGDGGPVLTLTCERVSANEEQEVAPFFTADGCEVSG